MDKRKDLILRFGLIYVLLSVLFIMVIAQIFKVQFVEKDKWMELAKDQVISNIKVKPKRGNIFATDGRLVASSIPTYYVYMDMRVDAMHLDGGKLFYDNIDSVSIALAQFFGDKTAKEYKTLLTDGYDKLKPELRLYPKRISYAKLKELKTLPLFRLGSNKSGLLTKEYVRRVKPFGSLAARTVGDVFPDEEKGGKNGLENYFDKYLKGTEGLAVRHKVANRYRNMTQIEPVDGMDLMTTIDIELQDMAERALRDTIQSIKASSGYAMLMEVKTGEIKAIVNLQLNEDGTYSENVNGSVIDELEPGSTFKTAALMAVLDESDVKITDSVNTGNGLENIGGSIMRDHNAHRGGFRTISVAEVIHGSSNVGISKVVRKVYGNRPDKFVDKLYEMGLNEVLPLQLNNTGKPKIKHPKDKNTYWSKTTLAWMSIGYETAIPPIYTLTFYNAIANNGKMISPIFVKSILKNGQVVESFEAKTIREQICKPQTLKDVQETLLGVVEGKKGTARNMRNNVVNIAGKSGTAQISQGGAGYKSAGKKHRVSFCGYFPAENPEYTCLVVFTNPTVGYPSGGHMAGSVVRDIAMRTMLHKSSITPELVKVDTLHVIPSFPVTKSGSCAATTKVLSAFALPMDSSVGSWMKIKTVDKKQIAEKLELVKGKVPDLLGMGAKDAFYLLGELGLMAKMEGRGKVKQQSPAPGASCKKGEFVKLVLE